MPGVPRELVEHALNVDPKANQSSNPYDGLMNPKEKQ
jgi:hypothetical protein